VQNATLWRAPLGVEKTVVEDIEFDEAAQLLVSRVCGAEEGHALLPGAGAASAGRLPMTVARDAAGGGPWTWAPSRSSSRPTCPG